MEEIITEILPISNLRVVPIFLIEKERAQGKQLNHNGCKHPRQQKLSSILSHTLHDVRKHIRIRNHLEHLNTVAETRQRVLISSLIQQPLNGQRKENQGQDELLVHTELLQEDIVEVVVHIHQHLPYPPLQIGLRRSLNFIDFLEERLLLLP